MRRILVESARRKRSPKHGGGRQRIDLADADAGYLINDDEVLAVDEALEQLAAEDPQATRLVQLRYFAGMSVEEAAEFLGIARSTAYEHWAYARASLRLKLRADRDAGASEE
jgi:RNA polymerase sigma factor (TIGR02999 family)